MSLLLIVVGNIWGVKCDVKTDLPQSGHTYIYIYIYTRHHYYYATLSTQHVLIPSRQYSNYANFQDIN